MEGKLETTKPKFRIVVAIDFGTDGTALSFANKETNEVYPRKVWYVNYYKIVTTNTKF